MTTRVRKLFFDRPIALLVLLAFWICFASTPTAETRQLYVKVSGEITGSDGGVPVKAKINNATFKETVGEDSRLVLDVGGTTNTVVTVITTVTAVATASLSNSFTNVTLTASSASTNVGTSIVSNLAVCADGSVTNVLALAVTLLPSNTAFASTVFSNSQTFVLLAETNGTANTVVTSSTNSTTTCLEGDVEETIAMTTVLTNIVTTNITTTIIADAFSVRLLDPQGNLLATFFEFDAVAIIPTMETRERFFSVGTGVDPINEPIVFGDVSFDNVLLAGQVILTTTNGEPKNVNATIQASGSSDLGEVIFNGKLTANDPFVPAPTNFNANAFTQ